MSAISKYLLDNGFNVYGTDINYNNIVEDLVKRGVNFISNNQPNIFDNIEAVIYTSAIKENDFYFMLAKEKNIPIYKRSEILGEITKKYKVSIGVSGSHGKTTVTSMISEIFIKARKRPTVFLGGENFKFGNYLFGNSEFVIYEACEFEKNFLDMKPKFSLVLNVDNDHMDSYKTIDDEIETFSHFIKDSISFINADDKYYEKINSLSSITYGINKKAVYNAKNLVNGMDNIYFDIYKYGKKTCKIKLNFGGIHNVYNALVAYAVADYFKIEKEIIIDALGEFTLVKRRNEYLGKIVNTIVYADYAHHPTELYAMFKQYEKEISKILFIFQPHTFSRTKLLIEDFVNVLSNFQNLVIYKTYSAREEYSYLGSAEFLAKKISKKTKKEVSCFSEKNELSNIITNYEKVVFLGAGDIYEIAKDLLNKKTPCD